MGLRGKGCPVRAGKAAAVLDAYLSRQLTVPAYPWDLGHLIEFCTQTGHAQPCPSAPSTGPIHIAEGSWGRPPPGSASNPQPPR